eukprot:2321213-Rhodomonas_salina.1
MPVAQSQKIDFTEKFGRATLLEPFNRPAALHLREHLTTTMAHMSQNMKDNHHHANEVNRLLDASLGRDYIEVKYAKGAQSNHQGRWYAKGGPSFQSMPRKLRHTLCEGLWFDVDFVNCHPAILLQMCDKWGVPCKFLRKYVQERDELLEELIQMNDWLDRDAAKQAVLSVLYGGAAKGVEADWWEEMKNEFGMIAAQISGMKQHEEIYKNTVRNREQNVNASTMSMILTIAENNCLEALFDYLNQNGCIANGSECVLVFDGLQIRKTALSEILLDNGCFLEEASEYVQSKAGWKLEIKVKPFDQGYTLPKGYELEVKDDFVIDYGDDLAAAEKCINDLCKSIAKGDDGLLYMKIDGVWHSDQRRIQDDLTGFVSQGNIKVRVKNEVQHYSHSASHCRGCVELIKAHRSMYDPTFTERLWASNLNHVMFADGVYSFKKSSMLTEAEAEDLCFLTKIQRPLGLKPGDKIPPPPLPPAEKSGKTALEPSEEIPRPLALGDDETYTQQIMERVLEPIMPDAEMRTFWLKSAARIAAGHVEDKVWNVWIGERNSGKGVLVELLNAGFRELVMTFNASSLLMKKNASSSDEAKKLSWASEMVYKRFAISNEIAVQNEEQKLD